MMLWLAGLDGIPKELFEAAKVDGAGSCRAFSILLCRAESTAFLVLVLSVINSFKVFREAYLISGDYPHESIYMLQHLFNHWFVSLDIQKMSAASVMVEVSIMIPVLLWTWKGKRDDKRILIHAVLVLLCLFIWLPLLLMAAAR